ncbi:hypothetical protein CN586_08540 [Bacillus toyonensis]|uniref:hypothetical protein n=1 Tax=Bacillus toyonensis TaxID=155322 RepID=UPI000BF21111|nr:hypothetical protein [Bacillus toyonensis]PEK51571.1 hypothetical protein CN586_08540 [Bacillus toyonensis]
MAFLDTSLIPIIGNDEYHRILGLMELKEAKSFRYHDNKGKQHKLTQKEVLKRVNRRLMKHNPKQQSPYKLSWIKKWWNEFE